MHITFLPELKQINFIPEKNLSHSYSCTSRMLSTVDLKYLLCVKYRAHKLRFTVSRKKSALFYVNQDV